MKQINHTRKLKEAAFRGATIVCAEGVHEGALVVYDPRSVNDPSPWTIADAVGELDNRECRYNGRQCTVREIDEVRS